MFDLRKAQQQQTFQFVLLTLMFTVVGRDRLLHCNCLLSVCNLSKRIDVWFRQRFMSLCANLINPHVEINKWHNDVPIFNMLKYFVSEYLSMLV